MRSTFFLLFVSIVVALAPPAEASALLPPEANAFSTFPSDPGFGWANDISGSLYGCANADATQDRPPEPSGYAANVIASLVLVGPGTNIAETGFMALTRFDSPWNDPPTYSLMLNNVVTSDTGLFDPQGYRWYTVVGELPMTVSVPSGVRAWWGVVGIMATNNSDDWLDVAESPLSQSAFGPGALWDHDFGGQYYANQMPWHVYDGVIAIEVGFVPEAGDLNGNNAIDFDDFVLFAECLAGPNHPPACGDPTAARADMNHDGDVDLADFAAFQRLFGGTP